MSFEDINLDHLFISQKDYQLIDKVVSKGTFGIVKIAKNIHDNELYAVKTIKTGENFDMYHQMRLLYEVLIHEKLHHPGIVDFKGINLQSFEDENKLSLSIITKYMQNGPLQKLLQKNRNKTISDKEWNTEKHILLLGISHSMKYLHDNNVIHRDLKPANILIDDNGFPVLCDFGLSKVVNANISDSQNLTLTGDIGTPLYMAPELFNDDSHYGSSVDVFAFSLIAYEIITGKKPYHELGDINQVPLNFKVINGYRPKFDKSVSKKLIDLVSNCWNDNASERLTFEQIYNKLKSDLSIVCDNVDKSKIIDYIKMLEKYEYEKPKQKLNEEINLMKEKCKEQEKKIKDIQINYEKEINSLITRNKELEKQIEDIQLNHNKEIRSLIAKNNELENKLNQMKEKQQNDLLNNKLRETQHSCELLMQGLTQFFNNIENNNKKALSDLERSSKEGNCYSSYIIGLLYEKKNFNKAILYHTLSSKQGNSYALNRIGALYNDGKVVKKSKSEAIKYYKQAVELGSSCALIKLGNCYFKGKDVEQNYTEAIKCYTQAAELGNKCALRRLGDCYFKGEGVEQNYTEAIKLYKQAAELGSSCALICLGDCYYKGEVVEQNYTEAIKLFKKAAKLRNANALRRLGDCYFKGEGVEQSYVKALNLYKQAAELKNSKALNNIGDCYFKGEDV